MSISPVEGLTPVTAFAIVGIAGMGAQWLAWRFRLPGIVLMLAVGLILGPVTGIFVPDRDLGALVQPMISLAVAVVLFEGGLTLNLGRLADARPAVKRLVYIGAPLGWLLSSLALMFGAGLGWEASVVFGGIMIVTGPTVIAPLLRQARLISRPAQVLQWEAIVNDPLGALAAVLAIELVLVIRTSATLIDAAGTLAMGIGLALVIGLIAGKAISMAFRRGLVPEYMKVPLLFVLVLAVFALADSILHESGLLAVTVMGLVIANADLPSYTEIHRFKEQVTTLLVSGVFILLAAGVEFAALQRLDWHAGLFILLVVLVARPVTVMLSLIGTNLPMNERWLIAWTGPRGVVLVAVAGVFGTRLVSEGIEDGALVAPLAFILVAATVVLHGFTLKPLANKLGLTSGDKPGLLLVGGSVFTTELAQALQKAEVNVLISDTNRWNLRSARSAEIPVYYGDILGETAEHAVEFIAYDAILAASDNDAYNTLVATDLGPEFGRDRIWQVSRHREDGQRHSLPSQLGGQGIRGTRTLAQFLDLLADGYIFRTTRLTAEYTFDNWRESRPGAELLALVEKGQFRFVGTDEEVSAGPGARLISLIPPELAEKIRIETESATRAKEEARVQAEEVRKKQGDTASPASGTDANGER